MARKLSVDEKLNEYKARLRELTDEANQAKGKVIAHKDQMKELFGVSSVKEMERLLTKTKARLESLEEEFEKDLKKFERENPSL